jgi:GNAT superfamily N-acetyltransferase
VAITIRPARPSDGVDLQSIERLAGERFRSVGMDEIADDSPPSLDVLAAYAAGGRSWVALDGDADTPVGYAIVDMVDDCAHVEQVSVRPDHQGTGVGRALLDIVQSWAASAGLGGVSLTTFTDVPWNRPLYEHLGFRVLAESEIGPELRAVVAKEAAHGLDPRTRVCMRRDLATWGGPRDPLPQRP